MKVNSGRESTTVAELWMDTGCLVGLREAAKSAFWWRWRSESCNLASLISQHARSGSIVLSDEWSSYSQLTATTGNTHLTVNHSLHFVDPTTGAHTQSVEGMWSCCKRMMREEKVMNSALFETYLHEFMWRKRFGGPIPFGNILKHIAQHYPV